ncbi:hypothetical protein O181_132448 [Austropuccinia psidii MF-1]|uniref:Uncharacterized protein n=1 Tax=Austropuccinia psidii MF-1 TaxID=1389203 RepID=A0A9Q3L3U8_9BASI|nr:hypothetical protein [Austropuccinia psidii MF-1]
MTTRRGSQYSIQSYESGIRGRINPSKGKRKGKIPSGTESTQGSALSQKQVPEIPIISELELELIQAVLYGAQGQGLENFGTNTPRSDELLAHPQKIPQRGANSEILQWMESTIIQTSNQKDQGIPCQKREETKEEASSHPLPQEGKKRKKNNWRKPYSPG